MSGKLALVAFVMTLAVASPLAASDDITEPDVTKMKMSDIRAHNAAIDKQHRYFIVCRTDTITGSLSRRAKTCRTRERWELIARDAQRMTNDLIEKGMRQPIPEALPGGR